MLHSLFSSLKKYAHWRIQKCFFKNNILHYSTMRMNIQPNHINLIHNDYLCIAL